MCQILEHEEQEKDESVNSLVVEQNLMEVLQPKY